MLSILPDGQNGPPPRPNHSLFRLAQIGRITIFKNVGRDHSQNAVHRGGGIINQSEAMWLQTLPASCSVPSKRLCKLIASSHCMFSLNPVWVACSRFVLCLLNSNIFPDTEPLSTCSPSTHQRAAIMQHMHHRCAFDHSCCGCLHRVAFAGFPGASNA